MKFIQYYLDCLSHASYLIADETTGRAVVVDPQRDVAEYLADAAGARLARSSWSSRPTSTPTSCPATWSWPKATGAKIVYSSVAETEFASTGVADGERYSLGEVTLEFRHTPGHTPESMSIVVYEHADDEVPYGVLTGDTLFIGDVGRPDLLASIGFTARGAGRQALRLAARQADDAARRDPRVSRRTAPARRAARTCRPTCGRRSASRRRRTTRCARPTRRRSWSWSPRVSRPRPATSCYDAILNRKDRELLDETKMPTAMTYDSRCATRSTAARCWSTDARPRSSPRATCAHAINIGLEGRYAEFAGSVLPSDVDIVLVHRARPGTRGQEPAGPHRLRPGDRLPRPSPTR